MKKKSLFTRLLTFLGFAGEKEENVDEENVYGGTFLDLLNISNPGAWLNIYGIKTINDTIEIDFHTTGSSGGYIHSSLTNQDSAGHIILKTYFLGNAVLGGIKKFEKNENIKDISGLKCRLTRNIGDNSQTFTLSSEENKPEVIITFDKVIDANFDNKTRYLQKTEGFVLDDKIRNFYRDIETGEFIGFVLDDND